MIAWTLRGQEYTVGRTYGRLLSGEGGLGDCVCQWLVALFKSNNNKKDNLFIEVERNACAFLIKGSHSFVDMSACGYTGDIKSVWTGWVSSLHAP